MIRFCPRVANLVRMLVNALIQQVYKTTDRNSKDILSLCLVPPEGHSRTQGSMLKTHGLGYGFHLKVLLGREKNISYDVSVSSSV